MAGLRRMLSSAVLAALTTFACTLATSAETSAPSPRVFMGDRDISTAFGGKTIDGVYVDGTHFTETYGTDGSIAYIETGRNMTGRWLVRAGTFCTLYDTSPTGGCYRVVRKGPNCFEFYFVARDDVQVDRGNSQRPAWTAQGWVKDQPATCQDQPAV